MTIGRQNGVLRGTIVVSIPASGSEDTNGEQVASTALQEGRLLSLSEVNTAEAKLRTDPHDWPTRLSLLAYYSSSADLRMSRHEIVAARRRHILWVIENRPSAENIFQLGELNISGKGPLADPEGAILAERAWRRAVDDPARERQTFLNAAWFCAEADPFFSERTLQSAISFFPDDTPSQSELGWLYAISLANGSDGAFVQHTRSVLAASQDVILLSSAALVLSVPTLSAGFTKPKYIDMAEDAASRAVAIQPYNPYALISLLQVLSVEVVTAETKDQRSSAEKKTYELFRHFDEMTLEPAKLALLLPVLADLAIDVKDDESAKGYAKRALALANEPGGFTVLETAAGSNMIHEANDALGRIALSAGDLKSAKEYLLKAATMPETAMSKFGPRMLLAQALLDRGEYAVVLQYLGIMKTRWKSGSAKLDGWIVGIQQHKPQKLNLVDTLGPSAPLN